MNKSYTLDNMTQIYAFLLFTYALDSYMLLNFQQGFYLVIKV